MNKRIIALFIVFIMILGMVPSVSATSVTGELTIVNIDYSTRNETTPTVISTEVPIGDVGESWQDLTKGTIQDFVYLSSNYSNPQENYEDYGKFEAGSHTLTQYYKPEGWVDQSDEEGKGFVGIHYRGDYDEDDWDISLGDIVISGDLGTAWSASPKEFDYWIFPYPYDDNIIDPTTDADGKVSGIFRPTEPVNQYQHLTYSYLPAGRLTVEYRDVDTGDIIAPNSPVIKKMVTKTATLIPLMIDGYELITPTDNGEVEFEFPYVKEGNHTFVFEYKKCEPDPEVVPHTIEKILLDHLGNRIGDDSNYFTIQLEQLIDDEWIVIKTYELKGNEKIDAGTLDIGTYRTSEINIPNGYTANNPNHTPFDITEESKKKSTSFTNVKDKPVEPEEPYEPPYTPEPEKPMRPEPVTLNLYKKFINDFDGISKEGFTFELWQNDRRVEGPFETNINGFIEFKGIKPGKYEVREILTEQQKEIFEIEKEPIFIYVGSAGMNTTIYNTVKDKEELPPVVEPEPELPPVIEPEPELPPIVEPEPEVTPPVVVVPRPQPTLPKTGTASTVAMSSFGTLLLAAGLWLQRKKK